MKQLILSITFSLLTAISAAQQIDFKTKFDDAIPVLNVGTFHMGYKDDVSKTEFDEHDQENIRQVHHIASLLARFKPTVIIVEITPAQQAALESQYQEYLKNPGMKFKTPDEVELLAFEVGRLSQAGRIYGID